MGIILYRNEIKKSNDVSETLQNVKGISELIKNMDVEMKKLDDKINGNPYKII